jgi:putative NADH-flavin reductase
LKNREKKILDALSDPENYTLPIVKLCEKAGIGRILITGGAATLFVKPGVTVLDTGALPDAIMGGVKSLGVLINLYLSIVVVNLAN